MHRHAFRRRLSRCLVTAINGTILLAASNARADDYFINTAGGDWSTNGNWSENSPPNSGEDAYLGYHLCAGTFSNPSSLPVPNRGPTPRVIQSLYSKSN